MKPFAYLLLAVSLVASVGCHKSVVPVHPGSISNLDSYAYDVLLVEQAAIASAREDYAAGSLPPQAKAPLNAAIEQYDITLGAWNAYHSGLSKDSTALSNAINALVGAVGQLQQALGHKP